MALAGLHSQPPSISDALGSYWPIPKTLGTTKTPSPTEQIDRGSYNADTSQRDVRRTLWPG